MKIVEIDAIPFAIPYRTPLRFASGEVSTAEHVLVRVRTADGVVGIADAPPRPFTYGETQQSIVAAITTLFAPPVIGMSIMDREAVHAVLARTIGNPAAKSALDMAIWDAIGKTLGQPVTALLGGYTDRVRVAHMVGFGEPAEMVAEAQRFRDRYGITAFKVKVGRSPAALDVAGCRALRSALGDDVELYVDGNRGWSPSEAAQALRDLAEERLTLAEELCPADDVLGRKWLVSQTPVPFVADESVPTPAEVVRQVLSGAATAVSVKTARTGFTTSTRVHHLCESLGVEIVMGNQIDAALGTVCTVAFAAAFRLAARRPAEAANFLNLTDDLLTEPPRIEAGTIAVRPGPGLGVEIDEDKLRHYRID